MEKIEEVAKTTTPPATGKKVAGDTYEHGFKVPLELHPQHVNADKISFMKGSVIVSLTPGDILRLGKLSSIKQGVRVGQIPWAAATGLFVNNISGRNKAFSETLEEKKKETISENLK